MSRRVIAGGALGLTPRYLGPSGGAVDVLGIETSCDDTAAAVVGETGVRSDVIYTHEVHAAFGGVVPELASRAHLERLVPVVHKALADAGIARPDGVAVTSGPGLVGALLVGLSFAKALAAGWGVPLVTVNHLEGHLLAPRLDDPAPSFPYLVLVASGGHTALYVCRAPGVVDRLGETVDDAAGEAFDKVARMLGLGWPGGPHVDRLAALGDPRAVALPRPKPGDLDFSFSGLKTAVRTHLARPDRASDADVCASFREAVVDVLCDRIVRAAARTGIPRIAITGGVAANAELRRRVTTLGLDAYVPPRARCTDNGAMIAHAGRLRLLAGERSAPETPARPSWAPGTP